MTYAASTTVSPEKSKAEIERTLARYGCKGFAYGVSPDGSLARVGFGSKTGDRTYRFTLPLPTGKERSITHDGRGYLRTQDGQAKAKDQVIRTRWRALCLYIKATLEAVESGIIRFDEAFAAALVLPDNRTLGEWIPEMAATGKLPANLPGFAPALEAK